MADENDTTQQELEEIVDGAWGDSPHKRGLARELLEKKRLEEARSRAAFDLLCGRVPTLLTRS
jgi:hypothetical protein